MPYALAVDGWTSRQMRFSPSCRRSAREPAAHYARVAFHVACTEKLDQAPPSVRLRAKRLHTESSPGSWSRFCTKPRRPAREKRSQSRRGRSLGCVHAPVNKADPGRARSSEVVSDTGNTSAASESHFVEGEREPQIVEKHDSTSGLKLHKGPEARG